MNEFSLRHLTREVLRGTTMTDPSDIAREINRRIADDDCRTALRQALRGYVREEITRLRRHPGPEETEPISNVTLFVSGNAPAAQKPAAARPPARSVKVAGIRDWWSAKLRELTHVGESEWRRLGDCSFEDLMFAAAERHEHAARNAARAAWYEQLAETVQAAGAARVRDLPSEILQVRLGNVAA
jgi:hypothetical protein